MGPAGALHRKRAVSRRRPRIRRGRLHAPVRLARRGRHAAAGDFWFVQPRWHTLVDTRQQGIGLLGEPSRQLGVRGTEFGSLRDVVGRRLASRAHRPVRAGQQRYRVPRRTAHRLPGLRRQTPGLSGHAPLCYESRRQRKAHACAGSRSRRGATQMERRQPRNLFPVRQRRKHQHRVRVARRRRRDVRG